MGIADAEEKIVVKIEEKNSVTHYIKSVGADTISYTTYLEEALTFQNVKTAESALKVLMAVSSDIYRAARGCEAIDDMPGQRTITVAKMKVMCTPVVSTILMPKD